MKRLAFSVTAGAVALAMLVAPALAEGDADLIKSAEIGCSRRRELRRDNLCATG